jgi:outer membrane protein
MMNKKHLALAAAVAALVGGQAMAQDTPWLLRFRAVQLDMANGWSPTAAGAAITSLEANNKVIGELDVTYFLTKNWATELILTVPQRQLVKANGAPLGSFNHLPPTLSLQYHFTDLPAFKPYVGLGVNYTKISSVDLGGYTLESSSTGASVQVGVDFPLDKKWSLNVDLKKVYIKSDVFNANSVNVGTLKLDPTLFGVGIGYRF